MLVRINNISASTLLLWIPLLLLSSLHHKAYTAAAAMPLAGIEENGGGSMMSTEEEDIIVPEGSKTVWLVRHAESENNVAKKTFASTIGSGQLPRTSAQWSAIGTLPLVRMDTPLSARGVAQASAQRRFLDDTGFVAKAGIEIVLHSPLQRARDTCRALFANSDLEHGSNEQRHDVPAIEQHDELYERSVSEHISRGRIAPRVRRFVEHLLDRKESRIAVVGHCSFFKEMLGGIRMENASIWRAVLAPDGTWRNVTMVADTPALADQLLIGGEDATTTRSASGAVEGAGTRTPATTTKPSPTNYRAKTF